MRVRVRWHGQALREPTGSGRLLAEPHRVLVELDDGWVVARGCACANCTRDEDASVAAAPAAAIIEYYDELLAGTDEVLEIVLEPEMVEPLSDGAPTAALSLARSMVEAAEARGIATVLDVLAPAQAFRQGTWVRVVVDDAGVGLGHIVVQGMLGQVVEDPWGLCTPGVSVMVEFVGRTDPAGHFCHLLMPIDCAPSDAELVASRSLCARAGDEFQIRHGWRGIVTVGSAVMHEVRARSEIAALLKKMAVSTDEGRTSEVAGLTRRLIKLLRAFALSPGAARLLEATEELSDGPRTMPSAQSLSKIVHWLRAHA